MTNPAFKLDGLGQVAVPVRDLNRAVGFYRDVLGLPFLFEVPGMALFDGDGVRILMGEQHEGVLEASILYYRVDDIEAAFANLTDHGISVVDKPHFVAKMDDHELWLAFLKDPDDHTFALMSEIR